MKKEIALILLIFLQVGCNNSQTNISDILQNPKNYEDKAVTIKGEVKEVFGLLIFKLYLLSDNTGDLVVISEKVMPKRGDSVRVKGRIKEAFSIMDKQYIVLIEDNNM
jgi:hypothetical protein